MKRNLELFFDIYKRQYVNTRQHFILMIAMNVYQTIDILITIVQAIIENLDESSKMYIYRILIQIINIILFQTILQKLEKSKTGVINIVTLLKYITLIVGIQETTQYMDPAKKIFITSNAVELYMILITFIFALESLVCQSFAIFFTLLYTITRNYISDVDIQSLLKLIIITIFIQVVYLIINFEPITKVKINSASMNIGILPKQQPYSPIQSMRAQGRNQFQSITDQQGQQIEEQDIHLINVIQYTIKTENNCQIDLHYFETILNNVEYGIVQLINLLEPVKIINPYMSHIILENDQISDAFLDSQIYNFNFLNQEESSILPQFNQSKDIKQFIDFLSNLNSSNLKFEKSEARIKQIQFFMRNITLRTLLQNLIAFLHLKFSEIECVIDFSLKIYIKLDNLYTSFTISPNIYKKQPVLIIFIADLSETPMIVNLVNQQKSWDFLIQDLSQKIKQPLNCTISMLEIAIKTVPLRVRDQYLVPALAACKLLISQTNDLLDYITLKNKGAIDLQNLDILMKEFIYDTIQMVKSQALFKGLNIEIYIKNSVPQFIRTDPNRLRQIVANLLIALIQITIKGKVELSISKLQDMQDHIEIMLRIDAQQTNINQVKLIEKTVKYFQSESLKQNQLIDLSLIGKDFAESIIIAFYLSQSLSIIPLEFTYEKLIDNEVISFILIIKNKNPNFSQQLTTKRQSTIVKQDNTKQKQMFGEVNGQKKHYSTSRLSIVPKLLTQVQQQAQEQIRTEIIKVQEESEKSQSISSSGSECDDFTPPIQDSRVSNNQQLQIDEIQQRDSLLTFGNRSSMYSSIRYSSSNLQPNELIECLEKMEKIKNQRIKITCNCPKVMIYETNDYDLFAIAYQLENIGIKYEYTYSKDNIIARIENQFKSNLSCCKGIQLILVDIDELDEQVIKLSQDLKNFNISMKKEVRIIGLTGFNDERYHNGIRKLPLHDFLNKPIMIDALLFIVAKWMKG